MNNKLFFGSFLLLIVGILTWLSLKTLSLWQYNVIVNVGTRDFMLVCLLLSIILWVFSVNMKLDKLLKEKNK